MTERAFEDTARLVRALDDAAVIVVMAIVPNLYSRNRMFGLMSEPRMRRARKRAIALRTVVRQLASGGARDIVLEPWSGGVRLGYALPRLAYVRRIELTELERATVSFLLERVGSTALPCSTEDRALVERTIAGLAQGEDPPTSRAAGER